MLIIEQTTNGRNIVKVRKDWTPSRIGKAYTPPAQNNLESKDAYRLQTALIGKGIRK
jgi:hypothetical protein